MIEERIRAELRVLVEKCTQSAELLTNMNQFEEALRRFRIAIEALKLLETLEKKKGLRRDGGRFVRGGEGLGELQENP